MTVLQAIPMRYRAPEAGHPKGWYVVAEAAEVVPGKLLPVTYLDEQLIVYRDAAGSARVSDAWCPHMGAHLASHDGCIRNGRVVCPFHKWEFDGESGQCSRIPYTQTRVPRSVKLEVHPTREVDGMVMMWYHPEGAAPDYEPFTRDVLSPGAHWDLHSELRRESTCPFRDLYENLFDTAHIQQLHRSRDLPEIASVDRMPYGLRVRTRVPEIPDRVPLTRLETNFSGVSAAYVFAEGEGFAVLIQSSATPIDAERFFSRSRILTRRGRTLGSKLRNVLYGKGMARRIRFESQQDMNVLNFKKHLPRPNLCAGDGPIFKWRLYQDEFYARAAPRMAAGE